MKLTLVSAYKSVTQLPETELPNFVVLTGVNGAGKTHLIEAIERGSIKIDDIVSDPQTRPIRLFNWANLVPNDSTAFASYQITQERQSLWTEMSQQIKSYREQIINVLRQYARFDLALKNIAELLLLSAEELISTGSTPEEANHIIQTIQHAISTTPQYLAGNFVRTDFNRKRLIDSLEKTNIPLIAFEESDFYKHFPRNWMPVDIFQQSFGRLFMEYQSNFMNNRLKKIANLEEGESVEFLSDSEFLEQYGNPPWIFVNTILETANLDFRINHPARYYEERPYEPILIDQVRGHQVKFADLSSGERILMSFALCLYYAEDRRQLVDYPKVLLFDEIDAPLHPSMTQSLLRTIQEVLVDRNGIKVIMTTHSPSTVALAPEASIYAMSKTGHRRLQKSTKDKALSILTAGVPTLSINYENRKQVFVESQYDAQSYEQIYEKLRSNLTPEISLNFISSGVGGKGSCDQVREVVNQLRRFGSRTVYGIIDWDLTNVGNEYVKVLGLNRRYSIENYVFDPLLLGALLLREKWIDRASLGLTAEETYVHLCSFDNTRLQKIADFLLGEIRSYISSHNMNDKLHCEYVCGQSIEIPVWFLQTQGHQLETAVKEAFQPLKKFQKSDQLKQEILRKVFDDAPTLISKDFVDLFQEIQND